MAPDICHAKSRPKAVYFGTFSAATSSWGSCAHNEDLGGRGRGRGYVRVGVQRLEQLVEPPDVRKHRWARPSEVTISGFSRFVKLTCL